MRDGTSTASGHPIPARPLRSTPKAVASAGAIGIAATLAWGASFLLLNLVGLGIALGPDDHGHSSGFIFVAVRMASVAAAGGLIWAVVPAFRRVGVVRPVVAGLCGVVLFAALVVGIATAETAVQLHSTGWVEVIAASFVGFAAAARFSHRPRLCWLRQVGCGRRRRSGGVSGLS